MECGAKSRCFPLRAHIYIYIGKGEVLQKVYPSLQYISLHLPRNLKAWNFTLVATTSCKNVETHPQKKRSFLLQIAAGYRSVRYNTDLPPPSHSKLFLHKGKRNITSTRSWTGRLRQNTVQCLKYFCNWL